MTGTMSNGLWAPIATAADQAQTVFVRGCCWRWSPCDTLIFRTLVAKVNELALRRADDQVQVAVAIQIHERRRCVPTNSDILERVFLIDDELEL